MFESVFKELKSQFDNWTKDRIEKWFNQHAELFKIPEPDGEFRLIQRFDITQPLISKGCIEIDDNAWKITAYDPEIEPDFFADTEDSDKPIRTVKLFTVTEPDTEEYILACRAWIKTSEMSKSATLKLGRNRLTEFCGRAGGSSKKSSGVGVLSSQWREYEVRFHHQKNKYPANFWLNLDIRDRGTIWIKDIRLFQAPINH